MVAGGLAVSHVSPTRRNPSQGTEPNEHQHGRASSGLAPATCAAIASQRSALAADFQALLRRLLAAVVIQLPDQLGMMGENIAPQSSSGPLRWERLQTQSKDLVSRQHWALLLPRDATLPQRAPSTTWPCHHAQLYQSLDHERLSGGMPIRQSDWPQLRQQTCAPCSLLGSNHAGFGQL